MTDRSS